MLSSDCGLGVRRVAAQQPEGSLVSRVRETADMTVFVTADRAGDSMIIFWR